VTNFLKNEQSPSAPLEFTIFILVIVLVVIAIVSVGWLILTLSGKLA